MDTTKTVTEIHISGRTIPLWAAVAKSGNTYFTTKARKANGERYVSPYGVTTSVKLTGNPQDMTSIEVDGVGTVKVKHDVTEPYVDPKTGKLKNKGGKPRATAERKFTAEDGQEWIFSFRCTLIDGERTNTSSVIRRQGGNVAGRVQEEW